MVRLIRPGQVNSQFIAEMLEQVKGHFHTSKHEMFLSACINQQLASYVQNTRLFDTYVPINSYLMPHLYIQSLRLWRNSSKLVDNLGRF